MTTADRIDPEIYRAWKRALTPVGVPAWPGADAATREYLGRHRNHAARRFSFRALFYFAKHRH